MMSSLFIYACALQSVTTSQDLLPSFFTHALFCSWLLLIGILEKGLDLFTVKLSLKNCADRWMSIMKGHNVPKMNCDCLHIMVIVKVMNDPLECR